MAITIDGGGVHMHGLIFLARTVIFGMQASIVINFYFLKENWGSNLPLGGLTPPPEILG